MALELGRIQVGGSLGAKQGRRARESLGWANCLEARKMGGPTCRRHLGTFARGAGSYRLYKDVARTGRCRPVVGQSRA